MRVAALLFLLLVSLSAASTLAAEAPPLLEASF